MPQSAFNQDDEEISAITDPVRLQQLQVTWLRELHAQMASINAWVTFFGVVSVLGLVIGLWNFVARVRG